MTSEEREAMARALNAIKMMGDGLELLSHRLVAAELAIVGLHKRVRMLETGESEIQLPVRAH